MPGAAPEKRVGEEVELSGRAQKCHVDLTEFPIDQVKSKPVFRGVLCLRGGQFLVPILLISHWLELLCASMTSA